MPSQVNVRQINRGFLKFILQTFLSQSGSYYLIGTWVELDIVLLIFFATSSQMPIKSLTQRKILVKLYRVRRLPQLSNISRTVIRRFVKEILKIFH
jgi:hypothetical protein